MELVVASKVFQREASDEEKNNVIFSNLSLSGGGKGETASESEAGIASDGIERNKSKDIIGPNSIAITISKERPAVTHSASIGSIKSDMTNGNRFSTMAHVPSDLEGREAVDFANEPCGMPREMEDALDDNYELATDQKIREQELDAALSKEIAAKSVVPVQKFTLTSFIIYSLAFAGLVFYELSVKVNGDQGGESSITIKVPFGGSNPLFDAVMMEVIFLLAVLYLGGVLLLTLMTKLLFAWSYIIEEVDE